MIEFSDGFALHRYWDMKEGVNQPAHVPPEPEWEPAFLAYVNETGIPIERPIWTRPIENGKIPLGSWVFDVKNRSFSENRMSFQGQLRREAVRAPAPEVQALAQESDERAPCQFCQGPVPEQITVTAVALRAGHDTILETLPLQATAGCDACRKARRYPDAGYLIPVKIADDGTLKQDAIVAALWAELHRLEAK